MMTAGVTGVPIEALATLRRRLAALPGRHPQREALLSRCTDTASTAKADARFAPIGWAIWHSFSCCRAPLSSERLMLSWSAPGQPSRRTRCLSVRSAIRTHSTN